MHHGKALRKLGLNTKHRWSLLRNQVSALIQHERIETTLPRAKELRRVADQMVTLAKQNTQASRRRAERVVRGKAEMSKLFGELGPRYEARQGGYTRVLRSRERKGDNATMAFIEYVDREGELRLAKAPIALPEKSHAERLAEPKS